MGQLYGHIHQGYSQDPRNFENWNQHGSDFPGRDSVIWLFSGHRNAIGKRLAVFFCGPVCCHWRRHGGCSEIPVAAKKRQDRHYPTEVRYVSVTLRRSGLQAKATQHPRHRIKPSENSTGCLDRHPTGQLYSHIRKKRQIGSCNFQAW